MTKDPKSAQVHLLKNALQDAVPYEDYRREMSRQAEQGETSGPIQTDALVGYTFLNDRRMRRWEKTFRFSEAERARLLRQTTETTWLVLTESWCGDAAPILPVLNSLAEASPFLTLRIAERDRHPELMALFPTDGALAIPKVLMLNKEQDRVLGHWGPRPEEPMKWARQYKSLHGKLSPEFRESLQRWYNQDKGRAIVRELLELLALE